MSCSYYRNTLLLALDNSASYGYVWEPEELLDLLSGIESPIEYAADGWMEKQFIIRYLEERVWFH